MNNDLYNVASLVKQAADETVPVAPKDYGYKNTANMLGLGGGLAGAAAGSALAGRVMPGSTLARAGGAVLGGVGSALAGHALGGQLNNAYNTDARMYAASDTVDNGLSYLKNRMTSAAVNARNKIINTASAVRAASANAYGANLAARMVPAADVMEAKTAAQLMYADTVNDANEKLAFAQALYDEACDAEKIAMDLPTAKQVKNFLNQRIDTNDLLLGKRTIGERVRSHLPGYKKSLDDYLRMDVADLLPHKSRMDKVVDAAKNNFEAAKDLAAANKGNIAKGTAATAAAAATMYALKKYHDKEKTAGISDAFGGEAVNIDGTPVQTALSPVSGMAQYGPEFSLDGVDIGNRGIIGGNNIDTSAADALKKTDKAGLISRGLGLIRNNPRRSAAAAAAVALPAAAYAAYKYNQNPEIQEAKTAAQIMYEDTINDANEKLAFAQALYDEACNVEKQAAAFDGGYEYNLDGSLARTAPLTAPDPMALYGSGYDMEGRGSGALFSDNIKQHLGAPKVEAPKVEVPKVEAPKVDGGKFKALRDYGTRGKNAISGYGSNALKAIKAHPLRTAGGTVGALAALYAGHKLLSNNDVQEAKTAAQIMYEDTINDANEKLAFAQALYDEADKYAADNGPATPVVYTNQVTTPAGADINGIVDGGAAQDLMAGMQTPDTVGEASVSNAGALAAFINQKRQMRAQQAAAAVAASNQC